MIAVLCILSSLISAQHCYGYIDMNTGSYIFQILLASLFGFLFSFRALTTKVKSFFFRLFRIKTNTRS